ncbi:MAG: hypothetical protein ACKV19_26210 [Verrucomicrobiales bacterium]
MKTPSWMKAVGALFPGMLVFLDIAHSEPAPLAYQGRLTEEGAPANGSYEMQFKLFDTPDVGTGTQQGRTIEVLDVAANDGVFSVLLDFESAVFDGSPRFLEIAVKNAGDFSALSPRQAITPVPYAIHSFSATAGGIQSNASGNVAIGTSMFPPDVRLHVDGITRFTTGGSGGFLQIGTPGGETGLSIIGSNRADLRFNGDTLALAAAGNTGPTPYENGIILNTNGNVGIGMGNPFPPSPWKLEVNGATRITPKGAAGGAIQFSTPNSETGMSILGANRADVRFDDATLKLVVGLGIGPPGNASGLTVNTLGNVGIGTTTIDPNRKLDVRTENGIAVFGRSSFEGIHGESTAPAAAAVAGINLSTGFGVYGESKGGGYGGVFVGRVRVGSLEIIGGADLCEPFPIKESEVESGSVMVIDEEHTGRLKLSTEAYDRRVAGVVSGANGIKPGISLRQEGMMDRGENVALTGRVYVRADASSGAIEPGDLLTTSDTPGHAMRVSDPTRAHGAVLGKAMSRLDAGQGMVLVLVALQ